MPRSLPDDLKQMPAEARLALMDDSLVDFRVDFRDWADVKAEMERRMR
jgi:hypothetical protein